MPEVLSTGASQIHIRYYKVKYIFATTTIAAHALLPSCSACLLKCCRGARSPNSSPGGQASVRAGQAYYVKRYLGEIWRD